MTIFDLRKTPLSPYLIRLIVRMYRDKLQKLSNLNLSNLLHYLGILDFEADKKSASQVIHDNGYSTDSCRDCCAVESLSYGVEEKIGFVRRAYCW